MRGYGGIGGGGGGGAFGRLAHGNRIAYGGIGGVTAPYGRLGIANNAMTAARPFDASRGITGFNAGRYARGWGFGALGEEPTAAQQAGELIGAYTAQQDARVHVAKLQAQIDNLVATQAKLPSWLRSTLQGRIDVKRAELAAYQQKLGLQVEGEQSWALSRVITQTGGVVAIGAGLALTALLVAMTVKTKGRRKNGRRRNGIAETGASVLKVAAAVAAPVAMGVSYSRNHSLGWAFLSGFVGIPYLVYAGLTSSKRRKNGRRRNR